MQGHVDGTGAVAAVTDDGFARVVTVAAAPELLRYVVEKGSIAVDGVIADRLARRRRRLRRLAHPRDARAHDARRGGARTHRQPGGRHRGQVRREARRAHRNGAVMTVPAREEIRFATVEEALEDIAAGRMIVVCRRRGPRERGRPRDGGRVRHARRHQLHGHARARAGSASRSRRSAATSSTSSSMAAKNEHAVRDARSPSRSRPARASPPASAPPTAPTRSRSRSTPRNEPERPRQARPRLPAEGQARRRARAHRPDRGQRRPRPPRRPACPPASSARS